MFETAFVGLSQAVVGSTDHRSILVNLTEDAAVFGALELRALQGETDRVLFQIPAFERHSVVVDQIELDELSCFRLLEIEAGVSLET